MALTCAGSAVSFVHTSVNIEKKNNKSKKRKRIYFLSQVPDADI